MAKRSRGLFATLVDVSFTTHATTVVVRACYQLAIIGTVNVATISLLFVAWLPAWVGSGTKFAMYAMTAIGSVAFIVAVRLVLEYFSILFTIDGRLERIETLIENHEDRK